MNILLMELLLDEDCPKFDNFWLKNQEYGWLIIAGTDFFTKLTVTPRLCRNWEWTVWQTEEKRCA